MTVGDEDAAFPFSILDGERVVNYTVGGQDLAVFFKPGTRSALDELLIRDSDEVGATGVFDANLDGQNSRSAPKGTLSSITRPEASGASWARLSKDR